MTTCSCSKIAGSALPQPQMRRCAIPVDCSHGSGLMLEGTGCTARGKLHPRKYSPTAYFTPIPEGRQARTQAFGELAAKAAKGAFVRGTVRYLQGAFCTKSPRDISGFGFWLDAFGGPQSPVKAPLPGEQRAGPRVRLIARRWPQIPSRDHAPCT